MIKNVEIQNSQGVALIATLLFLFVFTLLVMSAFEISIMQTKMQQNFRAKNFSLNYAENELTLARRAILNNAKEGKVNNVSGSYQFAPIQKSYCQNKSCYLIMAEGKQNQAVTILEEIYVVEWLPQEDGSKKLKSYSLIWSEL